MAIQSIRHKGLKRLFESDDARSVPANFAGKLRDMLAAIDTASVVEEIGLFPGWRLHRLKGDFAGYWSLPSLEIGASSFALAMAMRLILIL
jgi:proteic killer suppression protein